MNLREYREKGHVTVPVVFTAADYVRNDNAFVHPALPYDEKMFLKIT
jgi:hypothetical protein